MLFKRDCSLNKRLHNLLKTGLSGTEKLYEILTIAIAWTVQRLLQAVKK